MGWPKGKPRKVPQIDLPAGSVEERVANYLHTNVCFVPGCFTKLHIEDAKAIITIVKGSRE